MIRGNPYGLEYETDAVYASRGGTFSAYGIPNSEKLYVKTRHYVELTTHPVKGPLFYGSLTSLLVSLIGFIPALAILRLRDLLNLSPA
jgi:hypothetical protein